MRCAVVTGNPKPRSRTLEAAVLVAEKLTGTEPDVVVDVVDLGAGLLGWGDPAVTEAVESVRSCDLAVFASPTYKAAYTGLLKLFLDQIPSDGLAGVVAVPLMLGAGPGHFLAPEVTLKPVLVELGATCPTKGLYLLDSSYAEAASLDPWLPGALRQLEPWIGVRA
ncbi:MAG: NADPH-dependent FMN reductase [Acidimicrobiia bacterium]